MLNEDFAYINDNLAFKYLGLKKYLLELHQMGINDVNLFLLISLEKEYYEGDNLTKIVNDLMKLSNNLVLNINNEIVKFKVNKISFDVGDILNRHRWIYRYNEKYMLDNGLTDNQEDKIPLDVEEQIKAKAYETGKNQGFDWFKNNCVNAINIILPKNEQISKDLSLNNDITKIFNGNDNIPEMEYICYEHWLKHKNYNNIAEILDKIRFLDNSIIEKAFNHEANYFLERLTKRNEFPKFPNSFIEHSKDYLVDETIKDIIINKEPKNILMYYFGLEPKVFTTFKGKKAKSNVQIQKYYNQELSSLDNLYWVSIR